jgi:hypothetical protein
VPPPGLLLLVLTAIAVLATSVISSPAVAQVEPERLTFNTVEDRTTSGSLLRPCMEQFAVWMQAQSGMGWRLVWSDNFSGQWREPAPIDPGEHPDYEPRVGTGGGGLEMRVVWKRDVGDDAEIMYGTGDWTGSWTIEPITANATQDVSPDIADYGDGPPHVAWAGWDAESAAGKIFYAVRDETGAWQVERLDDSVLGPFWTGAAPRISVSREGVVHIVYRGGDYGDYHCHYARKAGGNCSYRILLSGNANAFSVDVKAVDLNRVVVAMSGNDGWGMPNHMYVCESQDAGVTFTTAQLVSGSYSASLESLDAGHYGTQLVGSEVAGNIYTENLILVSDYSGIEVLPPANHASRSPCVSEAICVTDYPYGTSVLFTNRGSETSPTDSAEVYVLSSLIPGGVDDDGVGQARLPGLRVEAAPNPFSATTWITIAGGGGAGLAPGAVNAAIFDVAGRLVQRLAVRRRPAVGDAAFSLAWDGQGLDGRRMRSGTYFLRIERGGQTTTHRLIIVR